MAEKCVVQYVLNEFVSKEKHKIAKEMLKSKMPKTEIIKYTKLSEEELNKIENEEY